MTLRSSIFSLVISCCLLLFPHITRAQEGIEAGAWIGGSWYFGDLNTEFRLAKPGIAGGVVGRYNFNNRLCLKLSANYGMVRADDADSKNSFERARNLSFRSILLDGTGQLEFNFLPYDHGHRENWFTPYMFGGITAFYFNPQAKYNGDWVDLRTLGTEGQFRGEEYYSVAGALAYGGGFKVDLNYEWSMNFELSARRLFTDYLDDVSTTYPDMEDLEKLRGKTAIELSDRSLPDAGGAKIGQKGRQRGDSQGNDTYVFLGVSLVYYFGDIRCPAITRH
jgi:hypothetical protein